MLNKTRPRQKSSVATGWSSLLTPKHLNQIWERRGHMTFLAIETKGEVCWQFLKRLLLFQIKLTDASGATPSPTFQPYRCTVGSCSHLANRRKTKAKRRTETLVLMPLSQRTDARSSWSPDFLLHDWNKFLLILPLSVWWILFVCLTWWQAHS